MRFLLIILLFPCLLFAQEFEFTQELDTIPVEENGWLLHQPWAGGDDETCPSLCDIDADGDLDLFVGSFWGIISFYENTGTAQLADYQLITREYAGVDLSGVTYAGRTDPQFCDLDGDGDYDLFSGDFRGLIHYWENVGTPWQPEFEHVTDSLGYIQTQGYSKPAFCDLDADGDYDLFVGNHWGNIWYYRNDGDPQTWSFTFVTYSFDSISVGMKANPCFRDIDADGDYDLFVGGRYGKVAYYRNDGDSTLWDFTLVSEEFLGIDVESYASPEFADIDGDLDLDFFCGRESVSEIAITKPGEIFHYENIGNPVTHDFLYVTHSYIQLELGRHGCINFVDIDADGDQDLFVPVDDGLYLIENLGDSANAHFQIHDDFFPGIDVNSIYACFGDLDADGDYDIVASEGIIPEPTIIWLFRNEGTPQQAVFVQLPQPLVTGNFFILCAPSLADIDSDGDLDLFLSDQAGFWYYRNDGSPSMPNFVYQTDNWQGLGASASPRPMHFVDIDDDDDLDLFIDDTYCDGLLFYRNRGTPTDPVMVMEPGYFITPQVPGQTNFNDAPFFVDIDLDGDLDLFMGNLRDGIFFFRNVTDQNEVGPKRPDIPYPKLDFAIGPNPANPVTWISFSLPAPQEATLAVYNILGAKVTTLASGLQMPGTHNFVWNAAEYSSGVYIIRLETGEWTEAGKVVVLE